MPGDRENVVKLNADHRGVCKFGSSQTDQDNFKLVWSNIEDLYRNALKTGMLSIIFENMILKSEWLLISPSKQTEESRRKVPTGCRLVDAIGLWSTAKRIH
jgi:hypothetical protein